MNENTISVEDYCSYYRIETDFIHRLQQHGLLTLQTEDQKSFLVYDDLPVIEKYIHLHYDLDINIAGIEAIHHLLHRIGDMQQRLTLLQNRFVTEF